jgi:hypothetical protein
VPTGRGNLGQNVNAPRGQKARFAQVNLSLEFALRICPDFSPEE